MANLFSAKVSVKGGDKLKKALREMGKGGVKGVEVGYWDSEYEDGMPVAQVAVWNEFGTERTPERPFMRKGNVSAKERMPEFVKEHVDSKRMVVSRDSAKHLGKGDSRRLPDCHRQHRAPETGR